MAVTYSASHRVLVAVVTYDNEADILPCLESVTTGLYRSFDILIIDNHSTDRTVARVSECFPDIRIERQEVNRGFAAGVNVALKAALKDGYEHVWLLNPDATADPRALAELVGAAKRKSRVALFSPIIRKTNGEIWFSGGRIDWYRQRAVHGEDESKSQKKKKQDRFLTGCALFVRVAAIRDIGAFDERFFLYYEDADLSLRATEKGWGIDVVPQAVVIHAEKSALNPGKTYHLVRSGLLFFWKWRDKGLGLVFFFVYAILRRLKNLIEFFVFRGETAKRVMYAHRDAWNAIRTRI